MLLIILAIPSIILGWKIVDLDLKYSSFLDWLMALLFAGITWFIFTTLAFLSVDLLANTTPKYKENIKISALKDNTNEEGHFFLGSGKLEQKLYYFYITETNKGKKMEKILVEDAYIKETNGEAFIEVYDLEYSPFIQFFLWPKRSNGQEYIFNVPNGTVTTEFEVNME